MDLQRHSAMAAIHEASFDFASAKAKVLKAYADSAPPAFKRFFMTGIFDRLAHVCILYFVALFERQCLQKMTARLQRQHQECINIDHFQERLQDIEEELDEYKSSIGPAYAEILMGNSTFSKPHQDRLFFEHLYNSLIDVLDEAFGKLQKRKEIEEEIGFLFRSRHFNLYARHNSPARSVDTLGIKELYSIKNETLNRALNAKLLSSLYDKPKPLEVQRASLTHSPLVEHFLVTPVVARSKNRETAAQAALKNQKGMSGNEDRSKLPNSAQGISTMGSLAFDSSGLPYEENLNVLSELKKMVQASLYTELAPMLTPRRLPPTRMQENETA